ncbi:MAG: hypothetical protein K9G76_07110 [Bacteroidales bacterium]|nr:hypothetical protein [Bacteroidales bacterium]MCF8404555.1 hypothetical protein [Bacteroidales bacterium]
MKNIAWPIILLFLTACLNGGNKGSENVLARVHNKYLYESELKDVVPAGTSLKDSISIVKNFVNNWVSENLYLDKAEKNLLDEDKKFDKQLADYRNSLIIYKYESKLISQNLDTAVTDAEIEKHYNENVANFLLKSNIVKAYYARFERTEPRLNTIRRFFNSSRPEERDSLEAYVEKYANLYFLDDEKWILFDDVLRYVPINTYNSDAWLQNNRRIELTVDPYVYFVHISDFMIKDGVSPLSFEKENIRQIILNKRKLKIINDMREEVFQTALENNDFETY